MRRVWHLLPSNTTGGVAINALCLHEAFCVTGSEDGFLRLWPLDFSGVFLEAGTCTVHVVVIHVSVYIWKGGVPFPIQNIYQLGVRKHVVDSKVALL